MTYSSKYTFILFFNTSLCGLISMESISGNYNTTGGIIENIYQMMYTLVLY
jgi:hypothetical protein